MHFHRCSRDRGSALAVVLVILLVLSGVGTAVVSMTLSRRLGVESVEGRMEAARVHRAFASAMRSDALAAYAADAAPGAITDFRAPTENWSVNSHTTIKPFPANALIFPRDAVGGDSRDPGPPGSLPWMALYSERLPARGSISLERPAGRPGETHMLDMPVETSIWRIPAAAVGLFVSKQPLSIGIFTVRVNGAAVFASGESPPGVLSTRSFSNGPTQLITAGADAARRIAQVYRDPSAGYLDIKVDDIDALPAGLSIARLGGVRYPAIDLGRYAGPKVISITGTATSAGVVLIGSGSAGGPVSISLDGPMILAGTNRRYVLAATTSRQLSIISTAIANGTDDSWTLAPYADASSMEWGGHVFIAGIDPVLDLPERWASATITLRGSLHLAGGTMQMSGPGVGTLASVSIDAPSFSANPFTTAYRHESFLVGLSR